MTSQSAGIGEGSLGTPSARGAGKPGGSRTRSQAGSRGTSGVFLLLLQTNVSRKEVIYLVCQRRGYLQDQCRDVNACVVLGVGKPWGHAIVQLKKS